MSAARGERGTRHSGMGRGRCPAITTLGTLGARTVSPLAFLHRMAAGERVRAGPVRVVSVTWACAVETGNKTAIRVATDSSSIVAGECGNRTHPTRLGRVTPVLKTGEATRPHPPPFRSVNHDRNSLSLAHFADFHRPFHSRKIVGGPLGRHSDEKSSRGLWVAEQRAIFV